MTGSPVQRGFPVSDVAFQLTCYLRCYFFRRLMQINKYKIRLSSRGHVCLRSVHHSTCLLQLQDRIGFKNVIYSCKTGIGDLSFIKIPKAVHEYHIKVIAVLRNGTLRIKFLQLLCVLWALRSRKRIGDDRAIKNVDINKLLDYR